MKANSYITKLIQDYVRWSPRSGGPPKNWDLDIWKFGISVCWWRSSKIFLSWSRDWRPGLDPHCISTSMCGIRDGYLDGPWGNHWYLIGVSFGGIWKIEIGRWKFVPRIALRSLRITPRVWLWRLTIAIAHILKPKKGIH